MLASLTQISVAAAANPAASEQPGPTADPAAVPPSQRAQLLGKDWKRSGDRAWTTSGDADGFHVLTADQKDGYAWKTAATLSEPGFDADAWIGNTCVTASGKRAVVVYAPRTFTNKPQLMARGGFTAIVDLETGQVSKLDLLASLSYYNPGCGAGESAVLTQSGGDDKPGTRLIRVDAATGKLSAPIETKGQVTSAIPATGSRIVAASGAEVIQVDARGRHTLLAHTASVPYRLTPDGDGGVVFLDKKGSTSTVKRITTAAVTHPDARRTQPTVLATGPAAEMSLARSAGTVYMTGNASLAPKTALPSNVRQLTGVRKDALVTTKGDGFLNPPEWGDGKGTLIPPGEAARARPVKLALTMAATGQQAAFTVDPASHTTSHPAQGREASPALTSHTHRPATTRAKGVAAAGSPTDPVEAERTCSVPRNDPRNQAMQPKPRQVEWAVDQAVTGNLNMLVKRPANWKNLGMPEYAPQNLFLNPVVEGGDRAIAQVMLGVATQESNMWQAGREAVPGVTANPLIGNYYGINLYDGDSGNDWDVNFANADCGYGITQITDHMRMAGREDGHGGTAWDYQKQRAAALDYTANIAAGLQTLISKWNETRAAGLIANHGTSARPENWYFALWAYNSGFHPKTSDGSPWGLGWANNPANPEWDAGRLPFMENANGDDDASAAARPQNWPYQEKVLGFAAHPPAFLESPGKMVPAFRAASWNGTNDGVTTKGSAKYNRAHVKAPEDLFCDTSNTCDPSRISDSATNDSATSGPCGRADFKCWWSKPATWKTDCTTTCGYEFMRFNNTYPEEADGTAYPPNCTTSGLPSNALIVDDVPTGTPVMRPGCTNSWTNSGSFSFAFGNNGTEAVYPSKADLHQLGAGFGGHFYYGHTRQDDAKGQRLKITGTWKLNTPMTGQAQVLVHLPDHGAQTHKATYEVDTGYGTRSRTIDQLGSSNRWVSLGYFRFNGKAAVSLSTLAPDGTGDADIAFDAVAFAASDYNPLPSINIPNPNPNAPDPDNMQQEPENFSPPTASLRAAGEQSCGPLDGRGLRTCITMGTPREGIPFRAAPTKGHRAGLAATSLVPRCATMTTTMTRTRYDSCMKANFTATLADKEGKVVGWVTFDALQEIRIPDKYSKPAWSRGFNTQVTIKPVNWSPSATNITAGEFKPSCSITECQATVPPSLQWREGATWVNNGNVKDSHEASAFGSIEWTNGAPSTMQEFDLFTKIAFSMDGAVAVEPYAGWNTLYLGAIRCDSKFPANSVGCVNKAYQPTWKMNDQRYPAAAAYYWMMREKMATHPGSKARKSPLHREGDSAVATSNRAKVCDRGTKALLEPWSRHPDATGDENDEVQCDEFPFASTKESGGQKLANGKPCVQLYAKQENNRWHLYNDDRYDPPTGSTWPQICGRAGIPAIQNMDAGRTPGLATFVSDMRLQDDDAYYFEAPRYEGCSVDSVCTVK
ncbi:hypothetical protein [Streptomyces sp. TLI_146]|uniref:golvesin C-terminal-like domain-containing protein n=1 Tax=Streptomyces sp. TLI_146 TaxID=1938858 RepID=UPI00117C483B|nr:hypothetical protein [Streptomyces sp. TLI_146]